MFREWEVDVKGILKKGDNKLRVYFHSPVKIDMPKWEKLPYQLKSNNDQSENGGLLDRKIGILPVRQAIIMVGTGGHDWLLLVYGDLFILKHGMM